ncbi:phage tail protein [Pasteurellaceae bacterium 15-036681]|nr:phage tail protein [Pasteurellaceae bacterium 15-036681]
MAIESKHGQALAGLLPPVSYDPNGRWLALSLEVEGRTLDRVSAKAEMLRDAVDVETGIFIDDWERVCGLTANSKLDLDTRVQRVIAKLNQLGGLSIGYLLEQAKVLGYNFKIHEPEPFRCGINRCGDRLWDKDVIWMFFVDFNRSDSADADYPAPIIKTPEDLKLLLDEIKPAFTRYWVRNFKGI